MKKLMKVVIALSIFFSLFFSLSLAMYAMLPTDTKLRVGILAEFAVSLVEVPVCYSHVANELGVESSDVRTYVIESLSLGMTPSEVETTLSQIAPVSILETYIVDSTQNTYISLRIHLCKNPFGDMVLNTYYSQETGLIRVEDAWGD